MKTTVNTRSTKRRSCCVIVILAFFVGLVAFGGLFAWFYTHPIQNAALNARVLHRLERISGMDVSYDSASLTIATGKYEIRNLKFRENGSPESVLEIGKLLARVRPWEILVNPEAFITSVEINEPSPLDLVYSVGSIKPGKRLQLLLDSVKNAQPPDSKHAGQMPIDLLEVKNLKLIFAEKEGILPGLATDNPAAVLYGNLSAHNRDSNLEFTFSGNLQQQETSGTLGTDRASQPMEISGLLQDEGKVSLDVQSDQLNLSNVFRELPRTAISGEKVQLTLTADKLPNQGLAMSGALKAGHINYTSPEKQIELHDDDLALAFDVDLNTTSGLVAIRQLQLNSKNAAAGFVGWFNYLGNKDFDVAVTADKLGAGYRRLLTDKLPQGWNIQTTDESQSVNIKLAGQPGNLRSVEGKVAVRGVQVISPGLQAPVQNLQGDLLFNHNSIQIKDLTGDYAGIRVAADGNFVGDYWDGRTGLLDVAWSAVVPLDQIMRIHAAQLTQGEGAIKGAGTISGRGTWKQSFGETTATSPRLPEVNGEFVFDDVQLNHRSLPSPVSALNGTATVDGARLIIKELSGSMQGNKLDVRGAVNGRDVFWHDPQLSVTLESKLDLAAIGNYLSANQKANLEKYNLSGQAESAVALEGPLTDIASHFTGSIRITDAAFSPNLQFLIGSVSNVNGLVSWDGSNMALQGVTGELNGEVLDLEGDLSAHHINLSVKASSQLENIAVTFPQLDKFFNMSGPMQSDITFSAGTRSDTDSTQTLAQALEAVRNVLDESIAAKSYRLDGTLKFNGADIRHISMPPARKESGRNIPAGELRELSGTVVLKDNSFMVSDDTPLDCAFSDTENCRLSGSIELRPDDLPAVRMRVSTASDLKLDTWALGWGADLPKPDKPPVTGKKFDLDAEITAPSVTFRRQQVGRSRAKLSFNMKQDETPRVTNFREVVLQGSQRGTGHVTGSGVIESYVWNKRDFPKWQANLDVQTMPVDSLLTAVFRDPSNIRGMITGNLSVHGVSNNPHSIRGQGSGAMRNLELGGTAVIRQLGQTTGRNLGGMQFETARAANFEIGNGALSSRDLALDTNGLQLEMHGDYWFAADPQRNIPAKTIDGALRMKLFKSMLGNIPIIGQVAELADEVTNALLLAFRVTGTADNPRVTPIALPLFQGGS